MKLIKGVRWKLLMFMVLFIFLGLVVGSIGTLFIVNTRLFEEIGVKMNFRFEWLNRLMDLSF